MIAPQFVALSLVVSSRWNDSAAPYLSAMDCLAYALERENDPPAEWPPLVARSLVIFERAAARAGSSDRLEVRD